MPSGAQGSAYAAFIFGAARVMPLEFPPSVLEFIFAPLAKDCLLLVFCISTVYVNSLT